VGVDLLQTFGGKDEGVGGEEDVSRFVADEAAGQA
jgi:hypothetical protein